MNLAAVITGKVAQHVLKSKPGVGIVLDAGNSVRRQSRGKFLDTPGCVVSGEMPIHFQNGIFHRAATAEIRIRLPDFAGGIRSSSSSVVIRRINSLLDGSPGTV